MIERLVRDRLLGLAGGRVYIGLAPPKTVTPYLRLFLSGGDRDWTLAGSSGARVASVQVDCWADTPKVAAECIEAVLELLELAGEDFSCGGAQDIATEDEALTTGRHRASMEFFLTS